MEPLSENQKNMLKTWAQQRDEALARIAELKVEEDVVATNVGNLSRSFTELNDKVQKHKVIIAEIDQREADRMKVVSKELAELERNKTKSEVAVQYLVRECDALTEKKASLLADINTYQDLYVKIFNKVSVLDKVVEHVVGVSKENLETMNKITASAKKIIPLEDNKE